MSQRLFSQGDLDVLCGWDRQLGHYFLTIERRQSDPAAAPDFVYDNLARKDMAMTVVEVVVEIGKAGIVAPPTLLTDLVDDCVMQRGNYRVAYQCVKGQWFAETLLQ